MGKRGVVTLAVVAVLVGTGNCIYAGDFHYSGALVCSDCHVIHYGESHSYSGTVNADRFLAPGGPFNYLLKNNLAQLCLACHDGHTDMPDVRGDHANGYVRAAGRLNVTGDGPAIEGTGHTIGSTTTPPGGTWTNPGLQCTHCHDAHGNAYYRNLVPNPGVATRKYVTYTTGITYTGTAAIQQRAPSPMSVHFAVSNVLYRRSQVGTTDFGLSEWCSGCHGNFHGTGGSADLGGSVTGDTGAAPWVRHPTRHVKMAQGITNKNVDATHWFSALASRIPVVSPTGTIPGTSGGSDNEVFCGSCHKAHGSRNRRGLIFDDETTGTVEDGTSLLQTCQQCHYQ